jgi:hypothetical protein
VHSIPPECGNYYCQYCFTLKAYRGREVVRHAAKV